MICAGNGGYFLISSKIHKDKIKELSNKNGLKGIFQAKPSQEGISSFNV